MKSALALVLLAAIAASIGCGGGGAAFVAAAKPPVVVCNPPNMLVGGVCTAPTPPPTASLSVNPGTISKGGSTTLTWQTSNATDVSIDGVAVQLNGSESVTPTDSATYTLTAKGAGGTQTATATVTVTAPPPPPPPSIPTSWTVTDLPPLPGYNGSQANAVNASGHAAGYSSDAMGNVEATEWIDGVPIDLGQGVAVAINDSDQIVGYGVDSTKTVVTAHLWQNGGHSDIGNWQPNGINNSGLVVGNGVSNIPTGIKWSQGGALEPVPGCQYALAVNNSGQIAGVSDAGGNATICGRPDFGMLGSATGINDAGIAVGFVQPSAVEADAMVWGDTAIQILPNGVATGINEFGWVIGARITQASGAVALTRFRDRVRSDQQCAMGACLQSNSHPFIWSVQSGLSSLPNDLGEADGISGKRVVGAGLKADGTVHGILLVGN